MSQPKVIIVGAGPVGLLTALLLAKAGHIVTLVERYAAPYPLPRAIGMSHESLRILQTVDAVEALRDTLFWDEKLTRAQYVTHAGEVLLEVPFRRRAESGWPEMQAFNQPDAEALLDRLARAQPNIRVEPGRAVTAVRQDAEGAEIDTVAADATGAPLRGSATVTLRAAYAIGCDGANSRVRDAMDVSITDLGFTWDWLVVDIEPTVDREWLPFLGQVLAPPRTVTWAPSGPGRRRFEFMLLPGETREAMSTPEAAWRLMADCGIDPSNARLVRSAVYRFRASWADRWRAGRLLLAGDSAHLTPPFLGQGLNSGIRDAATLAWRLDLVLRNLVPIGTLDDYAVERVAHVRDLVQQAEEIGRMICVTDPEACAGRDAMLRQMRDNPGMAPPPAPWRLGPGAIAEGDPHAGLLGWQGRVRVDGRDGEFDDVMGSGRFVLLGRTGDPAAALSPAAASVWNNLRGVGIHIGATAPVIDLDGTYAQWFNDAGGDVILVRPDFYVFGVGVTLADADGLVRRLAAKLQLDIDQPGGATMSDIDGIWDCVVVAPVGKEPHELDVRTAPDGSVTGTMTNLKNGQVMELRDGRFDGNHLKWTMQLVKPFKLTLKCDVEVEGNALKGHGGAMMVGKAPITGTKRA